MVQQTPRFSIDDYTVGENPPWDHSDLVNAFDEYAIQRDALANRPTSGTYPDELFYATDTDDLYRWDSGSSTWNLLTGTSGVTWENVKDYGAVGDNSADDTQAIQDAINAGDVVFFPPGQYRITTELDGDGVGQFIGCGGEFSRINNHGTTAGEDVLNVTPSSTQGSLYVAGLMFENGPQDGLHVDNVRRWTVESCRADGNGRYGFVHGSSWSGAMVSCSAEGNTDAGIYADTDGYGVSYVGCHAASNPVGIQPGSNSGLFGCVFDTNDTDVRIDGVHGVDVCGSYHETATATWDASNPLYCVHLTDAYGCTISGGNPMTRKGIGVFVENSEVAFDNPSAGSAEIPDSTSPSDFDWSSDDQLAWYADADSTVYVNGAASAPFHAEDFRSVRSNAFASSIIRPPSDLLGGVGYFDADSNSDGLGNGWSLEGTPLTVERTDDSIFGNGAQRQHVITDENFEGIRHNNVSFEGNTTYTIYAWLEMTDRVYFIHDGSRIGGTDFYPNSNASRPVAVTWTTGTSPSSSIIVRLRNAAEAWIDGVEIVEGAYTRADFPLSG